jgi:hypothetical protein
VRHLTLTCSDANQVARPSLRAAMHVDRCHSDLAWHGDGGLSTCVLLRHVTTDLQTVRTARPQSGMQSDDMGTFTLSPRRLALRATPACSPVACGGLWS